MNRNGYKGKRFVNNKRTRKTKKKKNTSRLLMILAILIIIISFNKVSNIIAYFSDTKTLNNGFSIKIDYTIVFNANDGSGSTSQQQAPYDEDVRLVANTFTRNGYSFAGWNTASDGSGTSYDDGQTVNNLAPAGTNTINLYAKWVQGIAEINGTFYDTLQEAIDAVPTDNTETIIKLLSNTSEHLIVNANKNIVFNLQNYTVSNNGSTNVIENHGSIKISNGTITTDVAQGAINNESGAKLIMDGGSIIVRGTGSRQAIYNNGGILEISGTAYLYSESNNRAVIQNQNVAGNSLKITGGTIVSTGYSGVNNQGTMVIGTKDGTYDGNSPTIQGVTNGITSSKAYGFYDGIIKGKNAAVDNETRINDIETDYTKINSTEVIDSVTYKTLYLARAATVTFNPNGGNVSESTRGVIENNAIGTLPTPGRDGFIFDGWFTDPDSGEQIDQNTIITQDVTFYAHWTEANTAEINGVKYLSINAALRAVPDNTETTIKLLRDASEAVVISASKNVVLDLQNHTLSNSGTHKVIDNNGTLSITNGYLTSNADFAVIDNETTGHLKIIGTSIIATGSRGAIYNTAGTVEISGNAYIKSQTTGSANNSVLSRGTIQNLTGTVIITGGTIIGVNQQAISNESTLIIGDKDGNVDASSPVIIGKTYGIRNISTSIVNFYDGIVEGITAAIDGTVSDIETGYVLTNGTITYEGDTYQTEYLAQAQP
ncbi:MAG: InlB B-repeat-containing protein [Clostridia bacterium]|nr:InlB B-repeat-containing protein [Clostridia bacterium]